LCYVLSSASDDKKKEGGERKKPRGDSKHSLLKLSLFNSSMTMAISNKSEGREKKRKKSLKRIKRSDKSRELHVRQLLHSSGLTTRKGRGEEFRVPIPVQILCQHPRQFKRRPFLPSRAVRALVREGKGRKGGEGGGGLSRASTINPLAFFQEYKREKKGRQPSEALDRNKKFVFVW